MNSINEILENTQARFIVAGLINTVFGVTLGFFFISFLPFHYTASLFLAICLGIVFNYFNSLLFVFKHKKSFKSFSLFIFNYIFIFLLNIFLIELALYNYEIKEEYAFLLVTPVGVLITYLIQKKFIFIEALKK